MIDPLDRAARDPHYRIAYESRQRQEADARRVNDMLARGQSQTATRHIAGDFSYAASAGWSGGDGGFLDRLRVGAVSLAMLAAFVLVSGAAALWMLGQPVTLAASIFCGLLCLGVVGVVVNFWRPIAGVLAVIALLWAARHVALFLS